jgi:hypothetical protein
LEDLPLAVAHTASSDKKQPVERRELFAKHACPMASSALKISNFLKHLPFIFVLSPNNILIYDFRLA